MRLDALAEHFEGGWGCDNTGIRADGSTSRFVGPKHVAAAVAVVVAAVVAAAVDAAAGVAAGVQGARRSAHGCHVADVVAHRIVAAGDAAERGAAGAGAGGLRLAEAGVFQTEAQRVWAVAEVERPEVEIELAAMQWILSALAGGLVGRNLDPELKQDQQAVEQLRVAGPD
jgi:hypothetical protein